MTAITKNYVIGASGLIGSKIYEKLNIFSKTIGTYSENKNSDLLKLNLLDSNNVKDFVDQINAKDNIFIMSAMSNPNLISLNKEKAKLLNITGTQLFISKLIKKNPRIIFMSSVEVFDGIKGNYIESDTQNPLNYYGKTKLEIEKFLENNYNNYSIVRTGWNIGNDLKSRCVVSLTYNTLLNNNAKMAHDNYFSIIDVDDTVDSLLKLIEFKDIKKIHLSSDEIINRVDLAKFICKNSKYSNKMSYDKCFFSEIKYLEPRGRVNNLVNDYSKKYLNFNYKDAYEVILKKIKLLDSNT